MRQFIDLRDSEARIKIAKQFGISLANLSQILNFKREGRHAGKIREMAKQNGGILMTPESEEKAIHILDSKGQIKRTITNQ